MRRMAHNTDADTADRRVGSWLHAETTAAAHLARRRGGNYAPTVTANQAALLDQIITVLPPAATV